MLRRLLESALEPACRKGVNFRVPLTASQFIELPRPASRLAIGEHPFLSFSALLSRGQSNTHLTLDADPAAIRHSADNPDHAPNALSRNPDSRRYFNYDARITSDSRSPNAAASPSVFHATGYSGVGDPSRTYPPELRRPLRLREYGALTAVVYFSYNGGSEFACGGGAARSGVQVPAAITAVSASTTVSAA